MMSWRSGVNMFLSVITAPIVLAQLTDFLIRGCYMTPHCSNIHSANLIRHAYSRYEHVRAIMLALTYYFRQY
jgi:hypothetical protein